MKRFVLLCFLLVPWHARGQQGTPPGAYSSVGSGGGGGGGATRLLNTNTSLDVFDRTGANLGANWTDYANSWVPNSGSAHGTTAAQWNISAYTGVTSVATQSSRIVVLTLNGTTDGVGAAVRIGGTAHTNASAYICYETSTQLALAKLTAVTDSAATFTSLNTAVTITGAVGDTIELSVVGNTLTCNRNNWANMVQANDASSPLTTGSPGVVQNNNVATESSFILTNPVLPAGADANIVFDGDSITGGFGIAMPWSSVVSYGAATNPYGANLGVSGKGLNFARAITGDGSMESMITTLPTAVNPLYVSGKKNILVIWACTNDLAAGGRTAAQCYTDLQSYVSTAHTQGWKVVVVPLLSENGSDTKMQAFNELLFSNSSFADAVVSLPKALTATQSYTNTTLFQADGIHPTQFAASSIIAPAISTAIGKL